MRIDKLITIGACGVLAAALSSAGCHKSSDNKVQSANDVKGKGAQKLSAIDGQCAPTQKNEEVREYDSTGDGRVDVRKLYIRHGEGMTAALILACREADLNGDGHSDTVRKYDADGRPLHEESDTNFDGKMDRFVTFVS